MDGREVGFADDVPVGASQKERGDRGFDHLESVEWYDGEMSNGVRGELTNSSDSSLSYVEISAYPSNSEDTRLGEALDTTSELPPGETYAFDAIGALMSDETEQVASSTIEISDGF